MTSPYMNYPTAVGELERDKLPYAVSSLLAEMEWTGKTMAECFEQRIVFFLSEIEDIKALYRHEMTRDLFPAQEGNLYSARIDLDNITDELSGRVHERPSPALRLVPSPSRPNPHEAA